MVKTSVFSVNRGIQLINMESSQGIETAMILQIFPLTFHRRPRLNQQKISEPGISRHPDRNFVDSKRNQSRDHRVSE